MTSANALATLTYGLSDWYCNSTSHSMVININLKQVTKCNVATTHKNGEMKAVNHISARLPTTGN